MGEVFSNWEVLMTTEGLMALLTLAVLEIVLGIDNLVFISILVGRAPKEDQRKTRIVGLLLAMVFRIVLLLCVGWIIKLQDPIMTILGHDFSWKDIILLLGGLFLLAKSTLEIHHKLEHKDDPKEEGKGSAATKTFGAMILQIVVIDMVFSLDSILTAVGLTKEVLVMIIAVVIAMLFMLLFAKAVGEFINANPTIVMLALSFLLMIGALLVLEAFHVEVDRGYIYFAMGFSFTVELLNLKLIKRLRAKRKEKKH